MHSKTMAIINDTPFPLADANGNAVTYLDNAGNVQAHYVYDAFGGTASQSSDMDDDFAFRFSSKYLDDETELYYYGYRFYDPAIGRWMSRDPMTEYGGVGLYSFVENRASYSFDYLGLMFRMPTPPVFPREVPWPPPIWPNIRIPRPRFPIIQSPHDAVCEKLENYIRSEKLGSPEDRRAWDYFINGEGGDLTLSEDEVLSIVAHHEKLGPDWLTDAYKACEGIEDDLGYHGGEYETSDTHSGNVGAPWSKSIGQTIISVNFSCKCKCLEYTIKINDRYDFDPKWGDQAREDYWGAEVPTRMVRLAQLVGRCGWTDFSQVGTATGALGSGCSNSN